MTGRRKPRKSKTVTFTADISYPSDPLGLCGTRGFEISGPDGEPVASFRVCRFEYTGCEPVLDENGKQTFEYSYSVTVERPPKKEEA